MAKYGGWIEMGDRAVFLRHEAYMDVSFVLANFKTGFMLTGPNGAGKKAKSINLWVDQTAVRRQLEPDPSLPLRMTETQSDSLFNEVDNYIDEGGILHVEALKRGIQLGVWED